MLGQRNITLSAMPPNPVTFAHMKSYLVPNINPLDTSKNVALTLALDAAIVQLEKFCDRILLKRTVTERIIGYDASRFLILTHGPTTSVASVTDNLGLVAAADYEVFGDSGQLCAKGTKTFCGDYTVVYEAGYDPLPPTILNAIREMAKENYLTAARDENVVISSSPDVGSMSTAAAIPGIAAAKGYNPLIPKSVARLLQPYIRQWC